MALFRADTDKISEDNPVTTSCSRRGMRCLLCVAPLVLLFAIAPSMAAVKEPNLIRDYLLNHDDKSIETVKSIEPFEAEVLDKLLTARIWRVTYSREGTDAENLVFMAVREGEVLRIRDFDDPNSRENLVKLLREDFRVRSVEDARRLVDATLALTFGFPFSEPETPVGEMRIDQTDGGYYVVDGERFGEATGYHIVTDAEGRVTAYEYSWELPVEPLADN